MKNIQPKIYKFESSKPGKNVVIMAGIHGNEKAGLMTLDHMRKNIQPERGCVYLIYANPPAIEKNIRYENKNLNRNFYKKEKLEVYEDYLADKIMEILDSCDALLDLHSYREPLGNSIPFLICEQNCDPIIENMDFKMIIRGLDNLQKGATDGYMYNQGKIGICAELGAIEQPEKFIELGIETAKSFLESMEILNKKTEKITRPKTIMSAYMIHKRESKDFKFSKTFKTFDQIKKGQVIAKDGDKVLSAKYDGYILFPRDIYPVGIEAFILAK